MPIPQVNDRIKEAPAVVLRAVFAGVGQLLLAADKVRARAAGTGWPPDRAATQGQARTQSRWQSLDETRSETVPLVRERATSQKNSAERPSASAPDSAAAGPVPTATKDKRPARPAAAAAKPATLAKPAKQPTARAKPAASAKPATLAKPANQPTARAEPAASAKPATLAKPAKQPTASAEPATLAKPAEQPTAPAEPAPRAEPAEQPAGRAESTAAAPLPGYDDLSLAALRAKLRVLDAATLRALLDYEKAHAHRDDVITLFERRLAKITTG